MLLSMGGIYEANNRILWSKLVCGALIVHHGHMCPSAELTDMTCET